MLFCVDKPDVTEDKEITTESGYDVHDLAQKPLSYFHNMQFISNRWIALFV